MSLHPFQLDLVERTAATFVAGARAVVMQLGTGGGKCLGLGTPVLSYGGAVVPVEKIMAGNLLMGPDSKPRRVLSVTRGRGPLYRIVPTRGEPWICNDVHVLTLVHTETNEVIDIALPDYFARTQKFRHCHKQFAPETGVDFAPALPLPLDPYFLGVWYGDGTKSLALVAISKPDPEIRTLCETIAAQFGLRVRVDGRDCPTYAITGKPGQGNPLLQLLRQVVGDAIFLPHVYLTASRADREAFLAGLLDADGCLHKTGYEIAQVRPEYAEGIAFLARSLGFRVSITTKVVKGATYWRLHISGEMSRLPLRIPRKQAPPRRQKKVATRTGFRVESIGEGDYYGFTLDGDGRFLLGDFTVTHNTHAAAEVLRRRLAFWPQSRTLFLADLDSILDDTVARLRAAGLHVGLHQADRASDPTAPIQVASLQTLHARGEYPPADFLVLDECQNACASSIRQTLAAYPGAILLGLTATPQRGDGQPLGDVFDALVCGPSNEWLTQNGYLVPCDLIAPLSPHSGMVSDPVDAYERWAPGTRAIVFAPSVAYARELAERFNERGFPAECATARTPRSVRAGLRDRIARGETRVVTGVDLFVRAWDCPSIETVLFARRFGVVGPWLQALGRGSRVSPSTGKTRCTAIDLYGSWVSLGLRDDPRTWSLTGIAVAPREKLPAMRRCAQCAAVFEPATVCPRCGATAVSAQRIARVLTRAEKLALVSQMPRAEQDARYLASLERVARGRMGLSDDRARSWALWKFRATRKRDPELQARGAA